MKNTLSTRAERTSAVDADDQARMLLELMEAMSSMGGAEDALPNGHGEFGLVPTNPIPCKSIIGSMRYLSQLRTLDGQSVSNRRLGSMEAAVSDSPIDVYELTSADGKPRGRIYISAYHQRNSNRAPKGFSLAVEATQSAADAERSATKRGSRNMAYIALVGVLACLPAVVLSSPQLFMLPWWYGALKALTGALGLGIVPIGIGWITLFARKGKPEGLLGPALIITVASAALGTMAYLYPLHR